MQQNNFYRHRGTPEAIIHYTDAELDRLFAYLDHDGTGYVTFLDLKLRLQ